MPTADWQTPHFCESRASRPLGGQSRKAIVKRKKWTDLTDELELLISDCEAMVVRLQRLETAAIMNVVKWGLQSEVVQLEHMRDVLQEAVATLSESEVRRTAG